MKFSIRFGPSWWFCVWRLWSSTVSWFKSCIPPGFHLDSTQTTQDRKAIGIRLRLNTFFHAELFVLGFSVIFIVGWGSATTALRHVLGIYKSILGRIGWTIVILLGLFTLKLINLPWLNYDMRAYWNPGKGGPILSFVMMDVSSLLVGRQASGQRLEPYSP